VPSNLDNEFALTQSQLTSARTAAIDYLQQQQAQDQSFIAKAIVKTFIWLLVLITIAVILGMILCHDWNKIAEPAKFLLALISSVLLPVVTLVIGHYFGKQKQ
jgi:uncharacterized membrane protein